MEVSRETKMVKDGNDLRGRSARRKTKENVKAKTKEGRKVFIAFAKVRKKSAALVAFDQVQSLSK